MFEVNFEVRVPTLDGEAYYNDKIYTNAETAKEARDKATIYIAAAYSETYAILTVLPVRVI